MSLRTSHSSISSIPFDTLNPHVDQGISSRNPSICSKPKDMRRSEFTICCTCFGERSKLCGLTQAGTKFVTSTLVQPIV